MVDKTEEVHLVGRDRSSFRPSSDREDVISYARRVSEAVNSAGGKTAIAAKTGIPKSTISSYMAGVEMKALIMGRLADACGVTVEWLATGREPRSVSAGAGDGEPIVKGASTYVRLPVFDVFASAGGGSFTSDENVVDEFPLSKRMAQRIGVQSDQLMVIETTGDSMEPAISSGDLILVDRTPTSMISGIYVLAVDSLVMVKRLQVSASGMLKVSSDNPLYPPGEEVPLKTVRWGESDTDARLCILGRVVSRVQMTV